MSQLRESRRPWRGMQKRAVATGQHGSTEVVHDRFGLGKEAAKPFIATVPMSLMLVASIPAQRSILVLRLNGICADVS